MRTEQMVEAINAGGYGFRIERPGAGWGKAKWVVIDKTSGHASPMSDQAIHAKYLRFGLDEAQPAKAKDSRWTRLRNIEIHEGIPHYHEACGCGKSATRMVWLTGESVIEAPETRSVPLCEEHYADVRAEWDHGAIHGDLTVLLED